MSRKYSVLATRVYVQDAWPVFQMQTADMKWKYGTGWKGQASTECDPTTFGFPVRCSGELSILFRRYTCICAHLCFLPKTCSKASNFQNSTFYTSCNRFHNFKNYMDHLYLVLTLTHLVSSANYLFIYCHWQLSGFVTCPIELCILTYFRQFSGASSQYFILIPVQVVCSLQFSMPDNKWSQTWRTSCAEGNNKGAGNAEPCANHEPRNLLSHMHHIPYIPNMCHILLFSPEFVVCAFWAASFLRVCNTS